MKLFPFLLVALLCGCVTTQVERQVDLKVQQAYFAELSAYYLLLKPAGAYKDQCFARPEISQGDCREVVQRLRELAIRVREIQEITQRAVELKADGAVVAATEKLRDLKAETEKELASTTPDQPPGSNPQLPLPPTF